MIGDLGSGATVSMPNMPSRSTTLAAPPPVVVTTATRAARGRSGGVRPERSGAISMSVSRISTLAMPQSRKYAAHAPSSPASAPLCHRPGAAPRPAAPRLPRRALGPGVGESVAENGGDADAALTAFLDRALYRITGRHDKGVVDRAGRLGEAAKGALAEHFAARRVDRDDASGVAVLAQETHGARAVLRRIPGCPDQRDRAGSEERLREAHAEKLSCVSLSSRHSRPSSWRARSSPTTGEATSRPFSPPPVPARAISGP